jgi:thiamine kinase-like enzyme
LINSRAEKLKQLDAVTDEHKEMKDFITGDLYPRFNETEKHVRSEAKRLGIGVDAVLRQEEKTLSPSDFGFHNALRSPDGKTYFIDFEYFGWDDPAKIIADFFLQPAVPVPYDFREYFYGKVVPPLDLSGMLAKRLPLVYALLSFKWCLIVLNPFIPFGGSARHDRIFLSKQLDKAKDMLQRAAEEGVSLKVL